MTDTEFRSFLADLCKFFEKKYPSEGTGKLWYSEVSHLPAACLPFIKALIFKKEFPKNLPETIRSLYRLWLHENPGKYAGTEKCPDCDGSGWISENRKAYKCGSCNAEPLSIYLDIPGFSGFVNVSIKKPKKHEARTPPTDWHDQF